MLKVLRSSTTKTLSLFLCLIGSLLSPFGAGAVTGESIITTPIGRVALGPDGRALNPDEVLTRPNEIAIANDGTIFVSDRGKHRIRQINPDGTSSTLAGIGWAAPLGDGGLATRAGVFNPHGVAVDGNGNVYITHDGTHRIRRIGLDGIITTIAGSDVVGPSGDGGPAVDATLAGPGVITAGPQGRLFFADGASIRMIDLDGIITTVAGTGVEGFAGDGGPATEALLLGVDGITVVEDGTIYFTDYLGRRVRKIDPSGTITTIAGTGDYSVFNPQDGGSALDADLWTVLGIAVDSALNVYVSDPQAGYIHRITPEGTISTIAGAGNSFDDNVPAAASKLQIPVGLAVDPNDNLHIVVLDTGSIRKIMSPDMIKPMAWISSPVDGSVVHIDSLPAVSFHCSDADSNISSCLAVLDGVPIANGAIVPNSISDTATLRVTATDTAGNESVATITFDVWIPPVVTTTTTTSQPIQTTTSAAPTTTMTTISTTTTTTQPTTTQVPTTPVPSTTVRQPAPTSPAVTVPAKPKTTTSTTTAPAPDPRIITGQFANSSGSTAAIARLYVAILGRQPEPTGHAYWLDQTKNELPLNSIAALFIDSPEFSLIYGETTDAEFVDLLYRNVMNRPPDTAGEAYWVNVLQTGTARLEVTILFSQSPEFRGYTQTS